MFSAGRLPAALHQSIWRCLVAGAAACAGPASPAKLSGLSPAWVPYSPVQSCMSPGYLCLEFSDCVSKQFLTAVPHKPAEEANALHVSAPLRVFQRTGPE